MVKVFATHNGLPGHVSSPFHMAPFYQPTVKDIKTFIENPMIESELSSIYTYTIEIGKFVRQPLDLNEQNLFVFSEVVLDENGLPCNNEVNLTITWSEKKNTCRIPKFGPSVYDSNNTIDDDHISADLIKPSSNNWQQMMAPPQPTLLLQQNQNNTLNGYEWNQSGSMEMNKSVSFHRFTDQSKLSLFDDSDSDWPINDDDQDLLNNGTNSELSLSHLQAIDVEDFLASYLPTDVIISSNGPNSSMVDLGNNLQSHVPTTNIAGSVDFQVVQRTTENRISNLMEQMLSPSNGNNSQPRPAIKRPNQTNVDEPNRPKRARAQGCIKPKKILLIRAGTDLKVKPTWDTIDYQQTKIPCISHFDVSKMISFVRNINKYQRLEYLSNRDPVRQQMGTADDGSQVAILTKGRNIVCIQGDKTGVSEKTQWLPLLRVPILYEISLLVKGQIGMGIAVVKEYCINDSEVGYYMVGNRVITQDSNSNIEESVKHDCIIVEDKDVKDEKFTLKTYMIQLSHGLDKIVGPALFKIDRSAAQGANINFTFDDGIDLPRLAVYFFKENNQTGEYEPDWETLCLSDYFHQKKTSELNST